MTSKLTVPALSAVITKFAVSEESIGPADVAVLATSARIRDGMASIAADCLCKLTQGDWWSQREGALASLRRLEECSNRLSGDEKRALTRCFVVLAILFGEWGLAQEKAPQAEMRVEVNRGDGFPPQVSFGTAFSFVAPADLFDAVQLAYGLDANNPGDASKAISSTVRIIDEPEMEMHTVRATFLHLARLLIYDFLRMPDHGAQDDPQFT